LRCLLARRGITFQRTKTWKEPPDPERDAKLDRIEHVLDRFPDRVFAFDEFGPLGIRPTAGSCWAEQGRPKRHPATYHRTHGVRYFHGCYSIGDDILGGVNRRKKGAANTLAALKSIRAARPDGAPIYVILDNLSAHKGDTIRRWAKKNRVELCFTPTYASWANPIEAYFGPLRQFTIANSNHRNHTADLVTPPGLPLRSMSMAVASDECSFGEAARAVMWLHGVAAQVAQQQVWDLLDEAVHSTLVWDGA
jgi:hypothetical protein